MKNRILSCVLAVLMVVSMTTIFASSVSAEGEPEGLTVKVGTAFATAGATAYVDLYVSAKSLPETHKYLRNWQFAFSGARLGAKNDMQYYVSGGSPFGTVNKDSQQVLISADAGFNCGTAAQITSKGGWKVASVAFVVPEDTPAGTTLDVEITEIVEMLFETEPGVAFSEKASAETVAGKIVVVGGADAAMPAIEGNGESITLPSYVDGQMITKMTKGGKLTGSFGTVVVPAAYGSIAGTAVSGATIGAFVLKNTNYTSAVVKSFVEYADKVYYSKRADGSDTTYASLVDYITNEAENDPELVNILQMTADAVVKGDEVSFVAGIAAEDLEYKNLTLVLVNNNPRDGEKSEYVQTVHGVAKTLTGVATVNSAVAEAQGIAKADLCYLTGATLTGAPAGTYTFTATLYGTIEDTNGNDVVVCSDPATIEFTVGA